MKKSLLIFVKNPIKGKVKTRLAATIGDQAALEIYNELLMYTENCTRAVFAHKTVYYSDFLGAGDMWSEEIYDKSTQTGDDLGERMANAFDDAFAKGTEQVAIIGSDCFEITAEIIEDAFNQLAYHDVVIGPALDGGYYLLALKSPCKELFKNIDWSTNKVFSQTLEICRKLGLETKTLKVLSDIDNESDLIRIGYQQKLIKN